MRVNETGESDWVRLSAAERRLLSRLVDIVIEADSIVWQVLGEQERRSLLELGEKVKGGV